MTSSSTTWPSARSEHHRVAETLARTATSVAFGLLIALAFNLPFEPIRPLVATPWLQVNLEKLLVGATAAAWLVSLARQPIRRVAVSSTKLAPPIALLAVATVSALATPFGPADALKFVGRIASGVLVLMVTMDVVTSASKLRALLWAVCLGAGISACMGLVDAASWRAVDPLLAIFKVAPTLVGGDVRLSATFQYATIAAMFFELATPLALALAATTDRLSARVAATGIAGVCSIAVVLTLTRAGIGALAIVLTLLLALAWARREYRPLAFPTGAAALVLGGLTLGLAAQLPNFDTRLTTENDMGWYGASYEAPGSVDLGESDSGDVAMTLRNTGQASWTIDGDHPFALGYRWLSADGSYELEVPHVEVVLPHTVAPGDAIDMRVHLRTTGLPPGDYRVAWGMLQQRIAWFHHRGSPDAETIVHVASSGASPASETGPGLVARDDSAVWSVVSRRDLWDAAVRMFREHPVIGVGPDNFRHLYGPYTGLSVWDERIHSNNLYLELLVDLGVMGFAAFVGVLAAATFILVRRLRESVSGPAPLRIAFIGIGASALVFLLHGFLDYFLEFTAVYLLFWMLIGLLMAAPSIRDARSE